VSTGKHKCCAKVYTPDTISGYTCGRGAAYEHEGRHYCKTHHPPTVKAKREESNAAWQLKFQAEQDARKKADAERAEQKRRAECFPELLEALQEVMAWGTDENYVRAKDACEKARTAIARATGTEGATP
jgi:hypothetical protein